MFCDDCFKPRTRALFEVKCLTISSVGDELAKGVSALDHGKKIKALVDVKVELVSLMKLLMTQLTVLCLWLHGRASEPRILRSNIWQFFFSLSQACDKPEKKNVFRLSFVPLILTFSCLTALFPNMQVPSSSSAFSHQLKAIIGPHTTENIKVSVWTEYRQCWTPILRYATHTKKKNWFWFLNINLY